MAARATIRALPNIISFSRVVLAAGFVVTKDSDTRLGVVVAAATTDFLDGWIARRARVASRRGALIDPIADRIFALVAVLSFLFRRELSTLGFFVLLSRDIMTAIGFLVARVVPWLQAVEFKARFSGKFVTVVQYATFIALLRFPDFVTACLWMVGIASAYSVVDYTYALWRARAA